MKGVQRNDGICLCLDGKLTVSNAAALRQRFLEALKQSDQVEIDLEGVTAVDLAGLQLLCSAHRTAMAQGKVLTLKDGQVPALQQARAMSGFVFNRSCRFNPSADCFFVGGMGQ